MYKKDFQIWDILQKGRRWESDCLYDNDYGGDLDDKKSTSCYVFLLNSGVVSWSFKK